MGLLESIKEICGCFYLSDLHYFPYNVIAKIIFKSINLQSYTLKEIKDAYEYIFKEALSNDQSRIRAEAN